MLSTLHTNDAPGTVSRLLNMGIEPFLVTASLNLILAQRLAPQALPGVQEAGEDVDEQALIDAGVPAGQDRHASPLYEPAGCRDCNDRGYRGRVAIYEVMPFWDGLKELVINGASAAELKQEAIRLGMQTLRMAALQQDDGRHDHARRGGGQHRARPLLDGRPRPVANLHQLLKAMVEKGASDLHITTGSPPQLRIDGELVPLKTAPLTPVETKQLCYSILTDAQKHKFEEDNELDLSFGVKGLSRFRANIFMQRGAVAGAFRTIPFKILTFQELGLPPVVAELSKKPRGLVLVTGPTGSGKSHHAGVDHRQDQHRASRAHHDDRGSDRVPAPAQELPGQPARGGRRHPDLQDGAQVHPAPGSRTWCWSARCATSRPSRRRWSSPRPATSASRTLHTNSAVQTINRILDVFPPYQQPQVRAQLSFVLEGVMTPGAAAEGGRAGPRPGARGHGPQPRHPEPHPRGQGPPDLLVDAGRPGEVRHADLQPGAGRAAARGG